MDIFLSYLQGVIEILGSIVLALVFSRVKIKWGRTAIVAAIIAAVIMILRTIPVIFGIHMVACILMIFIFIVMKTTANKSLAFISVFASFVCLGVIEYSLNQLFIYLGLLHIEDVTEASSIWMMMGYMQAVLMNIIAIILQLFVEPLNDWKNNNGT